MLRVSLRRAVLSAQHLLHCRRRPPLNPNPNPITAHSSHSLPLSSSAHSPSNPSPPPIPASASASASDEDDADKYNSEDDLPPSPSTNLDPTLLHDIDIILSALRGFTSDPAAAKFRLHQCHVTPSPALVLEALSRLRHDWAAAFTFFLWAGSHPSHSHSPRDYHSIISILAKFRRFDTAWSLISEMHRLSLLSPHTLIILIRRYSAVHDVARSINAFYSFKKFGFTPSIADFQSLLSALCRYKNVSDAEHLLICNERTFPFETKSFNIVLNGYCNVMVHVQNSKRFWREMSRRGIPKDVVSYSSMISCYSKAANVNDVLKMFNQMKDAGVEPDRKVYNAVVYALAKGKCVDAAKDLLKTMEEKGLAADAVTFNSLIRPLCKARRWDDARYVFGEMLQRGLAPSIRTYHAFFDVSRSADDVFDLLDKMRKSGCSPRNDTYIMLIRKLCRWREHDRVTRLWDEMLAEGLGHDRSAYIVLIHGLFMNGKLEEASKYYDEMKAKGFDPEPKTEEMIQAWLSGKEAKSATKPFIKKMSPEPQSSPQRYFKIQPELRSVHRERGFSLYDR